MPGNSMHDSGQCLGGALMRKECLARSAIGFLMPHQNRFGAVNREWPTEC